MLKNAIVPLCVNTIYYITQAIRVQICFLICGIQVINLSIYIYSLSNHLKNIIILLILNLDGKLLSLEHVWTLVNSHFKQNLIRDRWNAITQEVFNYYLPIILFLFDKLT